MNPIELIKEDHRRIEALFDAYAAASEDDYDAKRELAETIMDELEAHTEMEEAVAYPVFRRIFDDQDDKKVDEAYAEHDVAKNLIEELRGLATEEPEFEAKMTVLKENVLHHIVGEESTLLPLAEENVSGEEMARIGEEMHAFRDARDDAAMDVLADEGDEEEAEELL